jgi:hypothetical protein
LYPLIAKRIPILSEESDYGLDRSLAGSLGLRGATEYEWEILVPIDTRAMEMPSSNRMDMRPNTCDDIIDRTLWPITIANRLDRLMDCSDTEPIGGWEVG